MNIKLGNIQFHQVRDFLGYELTEADKKLWDEFHDNKADLSGKESGFHIFETPKCIVFKGEKAKSAILKMFKSNKIVESKGRFAVYQQ